MVVAPALCKAAVIVALVACALGVPARADAAAVTRAAGLESAIVYRINNVRASHGLPRLAVHDRMRTAGARHATNMARYGYFAHSWSTGVYFGRWIRWFWPGPGYTSWSAGENIYWMSPAPTARQVVGAWMKSSAHRANILNRGWRAVGVGAVHVGNPVGAYRCCSTVTIVAAEFGRRS